MTQWAAGEIPVVPRSKLPRLLPQRRGAFGRLAAYYETANHPALAADPQMGAQSIGYRGCMAPPWLGVAVTTLCHASFISAGRPARRRQPGEAQITP